MSARTIIEQLAAQGEVEFHHCYDDPLADRTFRIKDKPALGYDIGWAVKRMQEGQRVRRAGWNGKGMSLRHVPGSIKTLRLPYVEMTTAQGDIVPWLCSQSDLLARDWEFA